MAAKTDTPWQHNVLHQIWPHNCCLCGSELRVAELEKEVEKLKKEIQQLKVIKTTHWKIKHEMR